MGHHHIRTAACASLTMRATEVTQLQCGAIQASWLAICFGDTCQVLRLQRAAGAGAVGRTGPLVFKAVGRVVQHVKAAALSRLPCASWASRTACDVKPPGGPRMSCNSDPDLWPTGQPRPGRFLRGAGQWYNGFPAPS
jgi:hypothetical protein